jgi:hypothetical protein
MSDYDSPIALQAQFAVVETICQLFTECVDYVTSRHDISKYMHI